MIGESLPPRLLLLPAIVTLLALPLPASAADTQDPDVSDATSRPSPLTLEERAHSAAEDFRAGRFQQAASAFEAALPLARSDTERATLELNLGSCLFELGRFDEAADRFLKAAALDPTLRVEARLNAVASVLRTGDVDRAGELLSATSVQETELLRRQEALEAEIQQIRRSRDREAFLGHVRNAEKALLASDHTAARAELVAAGRLFDVAQPQERVDVLYGLGVAQLELGEAGAAKVTLQEALARAPNDADVNYALGRALVALGDDESAEQHLRRALELGLDSERSRATESMLEDLDPLPRSGWDGSIAVGGGYDTNPSQSGVASVSGLGNQNRGGSSYSTALADVGRTERLSRRITGRAYYAGDWLGLWRRPVRELTLQAHALGLRLSWAPSPDFVFRFDAAPSIALSGLTQIEPFVWEVLVAARADVRTASVGWARVGLELHQTGGFAGWEYLSGSRLDLELSHAWHWSSVDLRLGMRGRYNGIGTRVSTVSAGQIAACAGVCIGADYRIPLGYQGAGPFVGLGVQPLHHFWVWTHAGAEIRGYLEESRIVGVDASRKTRRDERVTLEVRTEIPLDDEAAWRLVPAYGLLVSSSNVAYDPSDAAHMFDYDDRNFIQHFIELNLEVVF